MKKFRLIYLFRFFRLFAIHDLSFRRSTYLTSLLKFHETRAMILRMIFPVNDGVFYSFRFTWKYLRKDFFKTQLNLFTWCVSLQEFRSELFINIKIFEGIFFFTSNFNNFFKFFESTQNMHIDF